MDKKSMIDRETERQRMKTIRVVAAIIIEKEKVFATQRGCDL